jgi:hypothetical protein
VLPDARGKSPGARKENKNAYKDGLRYSPLFALEIPGRRAVYLRLSLLSDHGRAPTRRNLRKLDPVVSPTARKLAIN